MLVAPVDMSALKPKVDWHISKQASLTYNVHSLLPFHRISSFGLGRLVLLRSTRAWAITRLCSFARRPKFLTTLRSCVYHLEDGVTEVELSLVLNGKHQNLLCIDKHGSKVDVTNRRDRVFAIHRTYTYLDWNTGDDFSCFAKVRFDDLEVKELRIYHSS